MIKVLIELNDKKEITTIVPEGDLTAGDFLKVATDLYRISIETLLNKASQSPNYNEEESKKDRAYLYDYSVVFLSQLANEIYPEHVELGPTPEELLHMLDEKAKEGKPDVQ